MTITVKLDPALEELLRRHASQTGHTTSEVVRAALQSYLTAATTVAEPPSAYQLGAALFGRHAGAPDLASDRKGAWAADLAARHARRR